MADQSPPVLPADSKDVFLCHNGADKDWVRELGSQIESETIDGSPSGRPITVFLDEWDIAPGENILLRLNDALQKARFIAIVMSPEMMAAPWPTLEWTAMQSADPGNAQRKIIPILFRKHSRDGQSSIAIPPTLRVLNYMDFSDERKFKQTFVRFITRVRGLPPQRGKKKRPLAMHTESPAPPLFSAESTSALPDQVEELILGNLLPVNALPRVIFSCACQHSLVSDVLKSEAGRKLPPFLLRSKRLYTFHDLSAPESPFQTSVSPSTLSTDEADVWIRDQVKARWYSQLLNESLKLSLKNQQVKKDQKGRFFFCPLPSGQDRVVRNRTVASKKTTKDGTSSFWVHHAARMNFIFLGLKCFLMIDPCYAFTKDGNEPVPGKSFNPLNMRWSGMERNASIMGHIIFWIEVLSETISTGGTPIGLSRVAALCRNDFGIEGDIIEPRRLVAAAKQLEDLGIVARSYEREMDDHDD